MGTRKHVVAHSVSSWLPLTMTWAYNQVKYIQDFSNIILTSSIQNLDRFPWDPIYCFGSRSGRFFYQAQKRLGLVKYPPFFDEGITINDASILHSHFGEQGWYDLPVVKKHRLKHVVSFYGYDVNMLPLQQPVWKKRYKELFKNVDVLLCEGPYMVQCLIDLGCPPEKVKVQRLGIEVDRIPYVPRKIAEDGVLKILIAGTFRRKKGIPDALEAIGLLKKRYPAVEVTVIGDATGLARDCSEKEKIVDTIRRLDLGGNTALLGFQPTQRLMEEAYKHHIFLSPSLTSEDGDTEGGAPVTIIEMAASGMPIISTQHCDIPFVLGERNRSLLVPERSCDCLAEQMYAMLQSPHEQWVEITSDNRRFIESNLNTSRCVPCLEETYRSLL